MYSRPTSPAASVRSSGTYGAGLGFRVLQDSDANLNDRDRCLMRMARHKSEVDREGEFKLSKRDVGYAERRFRNEVMLELNKQQNQQATPHMNYPTIPPPAFGPPPPDMQNNRYQKLYEHHDASFQEGLPPPRQKQTRKLMPFDELEKAVVKRCIRCAVESSYINNAGDFKTRIGFHRGDARRLYDILCADASDWGHYGTHSNMFFLINNCMNEIVNNSVCTEWGRWFGNVSRRRVDDLYCKLDGSGKMLTKCNGATVELQTPGLYR